MSRTSWISALAVSAILLICGVPTWFGLRRSRQNRSFATGS